MWGLWRNTTKLKMIILFISIMLYIEGNIGAGKSTLCKYLSQFYTIYEEPVADWMVGDDSLFKRYYKDMKQWAFKFQTMVITQKAKNLQHMIDNVIVERSFKSDYIFASMQRSIGNIDDKHWGDYCTLYNTLTSQFDNNKHIYIRSTPELCYNRCVHRARESECVPIDYLRDLHIRHEQIFNKIDDDILIITTDDLQKLYDGDLIIKQLIQKYIK